MSYKINDGEQVRYINVPIAASDMDAIKQYCRRIKMTQGKFIQQVLHDKAVGVDTGGTYVQVDDGDGGICSTLT